MGAFSHSGKFACDEVAFRMKEYKEESFVISINVGQTLSEVSGSSRGITVNLVVPTLKRSLEDLEGKNVSPQGQSMPCKYWLLLSLISLNVAVDEIDSACTLTSAGHFL